MSQLVTSYDTASGKTTVREVQEHPTSARRQPAPIISRKELLEMIESLRHAMAGAQETYDNRDKIDAERQSQKLVLERQDKEIETQLTKLENTGDCPDRVY